jgi:NAD(P)-dependent dehydrogenase (short-subunit alcohol dehydrogenase family)
MTSHRMRHDLRRALVRRLIRNGAIVSVLILGALALGATGYHSLDGLPWLDAVLNAAMILTGMGPVAEVSTTGGKVFATFYALFSGVFFLTMVAVLLAPALHHFLRRFHLDLSDEESQTNRRSGN